MRRRFIYSRFGQFEIGVSEGGLHLTVIQPDGQTATYWASQAEAEDLHARLGSMLQQMRSE